MTRENDKTDNDKTRSGVSRQDRLKSALRENLKRRKAQARQRAGAAGPSREDEPTPDKGIGGKAGG
ncbi:hypothetical protein QA640_04030 [Bradyrhizobium sp. CB82]|uniref:hypothetical protein n=1 Tax=Bradyrhizobium sp. CB82 TaxID=3039159 RepID=UPI0024B2547B|nr:hypothetical protein [Bradyrhizobium sp. CB82]WFU41698.1 hypothetical protein QA640_04030 [Bradyrhizobium sp. CB82]